MSYGDNMLSDLQKGIIKIVETEPGIGPGGVAGIVCRDKSQTRRAMRDLARRGYLTEQVNGNGYAYYPVGQHLSQHHGRPEVRSLSGHVRSGSAGQVIDVDDFCEIPPTPSISRAVTPYHGPAQPADSRTAATQSHNRR